ncbi:MAG: hypothetical protein AAFX56_20290 [Pseudomonadota bacterium]
MSTGDDKDKSLLVELADQYPRAFELLKAHPALLVSMLYMFASAVGMLFAYSYLVRFGINVFTYSQIGDFLLASFKEPITWGLVALTFLAAATDIAMSRRVGRKRRSRWLAWYGTAAYRRINLLVAVFFLFVFIYLHAYIKAERTHAGEGLRVELRLLERDVRYNRILLGTTNQFLFVFDAERQEVSVYPNEAVESIKIRTPAGRFD